MSILEQIDEDIKTAMRAGDEITRDTLRMIKSESGMTDKPDVLAILARALKSRRDSVDAYREAGRDDLVAKEEAEIAVIQRYLPTPLTDAEAEEAIATLIKELGITEKKQLGQLMKAVLEQYKGRIDGKAASRIAGTLLG